ncbi:hypothetical protein [Saccharothrix syringae]|uniref:Secreted protein n=1 Tax=Saccharothrix syringae TaxID=103733 RepID=A0A5Q0GTQ6_SACSY|nr:hypothetical protein [Saccharothrix syringae]QFZ17313.1 hypothetical protein EKG83_07355 [Saccharothrix syringae]
MAVLVALVLAAVFAPAPLDSASLARAIPASPGAPLVVEEESSRECRQAAESRSCPARFAPARNVKPASRHGVAPSRHDAREPVLPAIGRGRAEHLRKWSRPPALQVFRN